VEKGHGGLFSQPVRAAKRPIRTQGCAGPHRQRQRVGIHCNEAAGVARVGWDEAPSSRAQIALGERLRGELQREAAARASGPRGVGTLLEAKVPIERCRGAHNTVRPHSSLGYRLRATESHRSYRLLRYTSASGQGRAIGRAALMIDTESISGGRSVVGHIAPDFGGPTYEDGWRVLLTDELNAHVESQALFAV
jgi:hypothetical protein